MALRFVWMAAAVSAVIAQTVGAENAIHVNWQTDASSAAANGAVDNPAADLIPPSRNLLQVKTPCLDDPKNGCGSYESPTKVVVCDTRLARNVCLDPTNNTEAQLIRQWVQSGRGRCGSCPCFGSCAEALAAGRRASGKYQICAGSSGFPYSFTAYCDQRTAGGGWMLILAYNMQNKSQSSALQLAQTDKLFPTDVPTDPNRGFSHMYVKDIPGAWIYLEWRDIDELRFYCTSSSHNRTMHFTTNNSIIKQMAYDGNQVGNSPSIWNNPAYTRLLPDHTANLPLKTKTATNFSSDGFTKHPFSSSKKYYWNLQAAGRWECDDYAVDAKGRTVAQNTHHQVWVRMRDQTCYNSCQAALNAGVVKSGFVNICPNSILGMYPSTISYCDQTTAGGGWMLFSAFKHQKNQNSPLKDISTPTDPSTGYSIKSLTGDYLHSAYYALKDIDALRFYCVSSSHNRTVHFINSHPLVKQIAFSGNQKGNAASIWNDKKYTTLLPDHTAHLPMQTNIAFNSSKKMGLAQFPFNRGSGVGSLHWSIRGGGNRWECDDYSLYPNRSVIPQDTLHNIWVRIRE